LVKYTACNISARYERSFNNFNEFSLQEALTQAFVLHYSRISMMLERSTDSDTLSNRVVHVSVQLFSNENLAFRMAEHLNLLHVMVISLKYMMSKILIPNTLNGTYRIVMSNLYHCGCVVTE
jgi:E3 ubiquitin-protein ligase UBR3